MWKLERKFQFEAAHVLPNHSGKCSRLHGHSWVGTVICEGEELQQTGSQTGMLIDFNEIDSALQKLLEDKLDHYHLNESTGLKNPTSEEVSRWIFLQLEPCIPALRAVAVEETCTCRCEYRPRRPR